MKRITSIVLLISVYIFLEQSTFVSANCKFEDDDFTMMCSNYDYLGHSSIPNALESLSMAILQLLHPRVQTVAIVTFILVMPYVNRHFEEYRVLKIRAINYLHRMGYCLVFGISLRLLFRMHSPCNCGERQVGPPYSMPSITAMASTFLGMFLVEDAPIFPALARLSGAFIILLGFAGPIIIGFENLIQGLVGVFIALCLHYYSTRCAQIMLFIDAGVQIVFGFLMAATSKELYYRRNDFVLYNNDNNYFAWLVWGFGVYLFVLLSAVSHFSNTAQNAIDSGWAHARSCYMQLKNMDSYNTLANDTAQLESPWDDDVRLLDTKWTWMALLPALLLMWLSYFMEARGIGGRGA